MPIQSSYIQPTTAAQTGNIQRIIPQNTMISMQQQQQQQQQSMRNTNQLATSPVPPMYTQPSSQVPIYTTAPNAAVPSYPANATQISPLQSMSYPGQKGQPINSRNPIYMNRMNYQTTQSAQSPPSIPQNNIYVSNVPTAAATTMVYSQNVIPATNIVNSGIPSTVTLAPNNSAVITPSPISRSVTNLPNGANQMNPMMMSPDNKADLAKKVPLTTIVSSIPTMSTIIPNQPYPANISKLASTGMPTSPIKAIINSSINSKVAAKAAAMKQENAMNQNAQSLYNMNNMNSNIVIPQTNMNINASLNNDKIQNQAVTTQSNAGLDKTASTAGTEQLVAATTTTLASTVANASTAGANTGAVTGTTTVNANVASTITATPATAASTVVPPTTTELTRENSIVLPANNNITEKQNEIKDNNAILNADINNQNNNTNIIPAQTNDTNTESPNKNNEINNETKNIDVLSTEDITKIENVENLNILDSMLYNPKDKLQESGDLPINSEILNELDPNKDQSNKFLKDLDTLYENNDTMKWLEDDTSWNQATQLSQFPLPVEDKKNQKENESKDLGSLTDINTNDESLNENNNQLWLSDDIDCLLQSENFQV